MAILPAQPGPLIGRQAELALITQQLGCADVRLLTLMGPAGTGKTRLAIEVAGLMSQSFADGPDFVDLAPIHEPALVAAALARTLGLREERDRPLMQTLKDQMASQQRLLLLDNFEQILGAAPQLSELLVACPGLEAHRHEPCCAATQVGTRHACCPARRT